ncbi:unnamed protein product [marine sediment metagenome]|uniref:Uncharacterized protein n=1 Tax=marine sediment metagenome TaxID=412755 RepID=X1SQK3_9ZZZZ
MARRKSTRKGQRRKTAKRAYMKTTRRRRYGSRRGRVSVARPRRARSTGIVKARAMGAIKECAWITGGGALGTAANRFMPAGMLGQSSDLVVGAGALAYGVYRNDPKAIYLGFGALYPRIQQQVNRLVGA